jgi:peptidoglycan/LPS O-acetylase OafA/YrhL
MSNHEHSVVHVPALDGLRGVAVLLVMIRHISEQFQAPNSLSRWIKAAAFAGLDGRRPILRALRISHHGHFMGCEGPQ